MAHEEQIDPAKLEKEVRAERKFSLSEAIAREAKGTFDGVSAVPALTQAQNAIDLYLRDQLRDSSGALVRTLQARLGGNASLVGSHLRDPLAALEVEVRRFLDDERKLHELVRQVDQRYGQMFQERPHFQKPGEEPHPDDEYTHASVRAALEELRARLDAR